MSPPPPPSSSSSSGTSFPILAISILGILTTAILLVSYYVFVIKCCFNWRRVDILTSLATSRRRRRLDDHPSSSPFTFYAAETRGLEENVIRAIPIIRFRKGTDDDVADRKKCSTFFFHECAVCLTEFADGESVRLLPNCSHAFHIDCIDTWLQTNSNCPLCRSEISSPIPSEHFIAHFPIHDVVDSVVIDVGDDGVGGCTTTGQDPTGEPKSPPVQNRSTPSPRKKQQVPEQRWPQKKRRKLQHLTSMGDECIGVRSNDERFSSVQPIRRSISMDSSTDRKLYISVQEILRQQQSLQLQQEASAVAAIGEGSSGGAGGGSGPHRRAFFYFGHSSLLAVVPVQFVT